MIICQNCFTDGIIKGVISSKSTRSGRCETCSSNGKLYNTDEDNYLEDYFSSLLEIYTPVSQIPNFPSKDGRLLQTELLNSWDIFASKYESTVYEILKSICSNQYEVSPELFEQKVGIENIINAEYMGENSLLCSNDWDLFVQDLKTKNRFHSKHINKKLLEKYCSYILKNYKKGKRFYRCRISDSIEGFPVNKMGAPETGKSSDGRANSRGIRCLYLGDSKETTIYETRVGKYDRICIGTFSLKEDIVVVDFKSINKISPFTEGIIDNITELAVNKQYLEKINIEMSKIMRRKDDVLDYLPTQYITDFVKSIENEGVSIYSGIEYKSVMNDKGYNLAIFNPDLFECEEVNTVNITQLNYIFS